MFENNKKTFIICSPTIGSYACVSIINKALDYKYVKLIITNYNKDMKYLDDICNGDIVYIVNFTLPIDIMQSLNNRCELYWIDCHEKAIDRASKATFNPKGLRCASTVSPLLTWKYFYNDDSVPTVIDLISDYEAFTFKYEDTLNFHHGIANIDTRPYHSKNELWKDLLSITNHNGVYSGRSKQASLYLETIMKRGKEISEYNNLLSSACAKDLAFVTTLNGHKVLAMNARTGSSFVFNEVSEDIRKSVDAFVTFSWIENVKKWRFSVYTPDTHKVNVIKIVESLGGGGSPNVCGVALRELPSEFLSADGPNMTTEPYYKELYDFVNVNPSAKYAMLKGMGLTIKTCGRQVVFGGFTALALNTFHTTKDIIHQFDATGFQLVVLFTYTKTGYWRLTIFNVLSDLDLSALQLSLNGKYNEEGALVVFTKTLNFEKLTR